MRRDLQPRGVVNRYSGLRVFEHMLTHKRCTRDGVVQHKPNRLPLHLAQEGCKKTERNVIKLRVRVSRTNANRSGRQRSAIDQTLENTSISGRKKRTACLNKLPPATTTTTTSQPISISCYTNHSSLQQQQQQPKLNQRPTDDTPGVQEDTIEFTRTPHLDRLLCYR